MNSSIVLYVNGNIYTEMFSEIEVYSSMENISGTFSAKTTRSYPDEDGNLSSADQFPIKMGDQYELVKDLELMSKGYIDSISVDDSPDGGNITIEGRDITADLADCVFENNIKENEWQNLTIGDIIRRICTPFDIPVEVDPAVLRQTSIRLDKFTVDPGTTCLESIMKLCLKNGIAPLSYGGGYLSLTRAAAVVTFDKNRIDDTNIKGRSILMNDRERFSKYTIEGDSNGIYKRENTQTEASSSVEDKGVTRYRPYVITSDVSVDVKDCKNRAAFERNMRQGKSRQVTYQLEGWGQRSNGNIWRINRLVSVKDQMFGIDDDMLISEIAYTVSADEGFNVELTLVSKNTYSLEEPVELYKSGFDVNTGFGSVNPGAGKEKKLPYSRSTRR